jgi:hypothetical protein
MSCRCDLCGKFRKDEDVVAQEYACWDGLQVDHSFECKFCMSQVDYDRYFKKDEDGICYK